VTAVVLAGGLGTRIRPVLGDAPKLLALLAGYPFVDYLLGWMERAGIEEVFFCLGVGADRVLEHLRSRREHRLRWSAEVEPAPLGTAGALRHASKRLQGRTLLILNGDTYAGADLAEFRRLHRESRAEASLLCTRLADASRFGTVRVGPASRIVQFAEKRTPPPGGDPGGVISAGVYLFQPEMLERILAMPGPSLEKDVFEQLPAGHLHAVIAEFPFIDFGTPEQFQLGQAFFLKLHHLVQPVKTD
jgi:NDP-sugar pyrophosphorylase family protein